MTIVYIITILVLASFVVYFIITWRKRKYKTSLNDEEHKFWDILIKASSAVLTIGTIIISAITYLDNQRESINQREREFRKEIASTQLEYYTEISIAISDFLVIAENSDSISTPSYYAAINEFKKLYYGKLNLVESAKVEDAIYRFKISLDRFEGGDEKIGIHQLRLDAFNVNSACRESIGITSGMKLETLKHFMK